tara:strand:+ start:718 stop:1017 length:300 start_codon:yes stop_codon:yes gene_type:complete
MSYNLFLSSSSAVRMATLITAVRPDIVFGTALWGLKKTCSGMYYLLLGNNTSEQIDEKKLLLELSNKTNSQQEEIKKLSEKINILTDYIEKNSNKKNNI